MSPNVALVSTGAVVLSTSLDAAIIIVVVALLDDGSVFVSPNVALVSTGAVVLSTSLDAAIITVVLALLDDGSVAVLGKVVLVSIGTVALCFITFLLRSEEAAISRCLTLDERNTAPGLAAMEEVARPCFRPTEEEGFF